MFEREGFKRSRRLGKSHWVVIKVVRKSSREATRKSRGEQLTLYFSPLNGHHVGGVTRGRHRS